MTETRVVNIRHSPCDVIIDRTTIFGNPFPEWKWGREECIKKFEQYFWQRIERDLEWKAEVLKIRDKGKNGVVRIGCHCAPLRCHGDIYKEFLETYDEVEKIKLLPVLKSLSAELDRLATTEGWYEPELQGEALYQLSQIDNYEAKRLCASLENDPEFDLVGAIFELMGREA